MGLGPEIGDPAFFIELTRGHSAIITKRYRGDMYQLFKHVKVIDSGIEARLKEILKGMLKEGGVFCSDIKPQNVLVNWDRSGVTKIVATDFGADWCCNSHNRPVCPFFFRQPDLVEGDGVQYLLGLQYLSFAVYTLDYNGIYIFEREMKQLREDCQTPAFKQFLNRLCGSLETCGRVKPPFYYLQWFLKNNEKEVPDDHIELIEGALQLYFE